MKCDTCKNITFERHEDYMGQPMWYYGECKESCKVPTDSCSKYIEGEPEKIDCRIKGDF